EFGLDVTRTQSELEPPVRELVGSGDVTGQQDRVVKRGVDDQSGQPNVLRCLGGEYQGRKRRGHAEVIRNADHVETLILGLTAFGYPVAPGSGLHQIHPEPKTASLGWFHVRTR